MRWLSPLVEIGVSKNKSSFLQVLIWKVVGIGRKVCAGSFANLDVVLMNEMGAGGWWNDALSFDLFLRNYEVPPCLSPFSAKDLTPRNTREVTLHIKYKGSDPPLSILHPPTHA